MTLITLQTDFGTRDAFVAAMKAVILRIAPTMPIIDVTHDIPAYDRRTPGLNWLGLIEHCPPGTVHVAVIDPGVGTARAIVVAQIAEQLFLAPDNGLLTPLLELHGATAACYRLEHPHWRATHPHPTFHGRDIFAPAAAHLALGANPADAGPRLDPAALHRYDWPHPDIVPGRITGEVLHIDRFGNLWTNVRIPDLSQAGLTPNSARIQLEAHSIAGVQPSYGETVGALIGVVNSVGYIEIAQVQGDAAVALGVTIGAPVVIAG